MDHLSEHPEHAVDWDVECIHRLQDGGERVISALHSLDYLSGADHLSDVTNRALRVPGGPQMDGLRPAAAGRRDQPWVVAVVDQVLAHARRSGGPARQ